MSSGTKTIFVISCHMNRMVIALFESLVLMGVKVPEINFVLDNCTILKIEKVNDKVIITMKYPTVNSNPARFRSLEQINELQIAFIMPEFPENLIIYLVRHGEGFHNVTGTSIEKIYDAELTAKGKEQILPASDEIQKDIRLSGYENYKIFLGCTHLKRTWQTIYNLYEKFSEELKSKVHNEIFIIPGLHEMIRQMNTPQHYECGSPQKRLALNPFYPEDEYHRYKGTVTKSDITDEELKKIVFENKPKNNIFDGIVERTYQETGKEEINLNWLFYEETHITRGITYEQCADETVIKAICNFNDYLQRNKFL